MENDELKYSKDYMEMRKGLEIQFKYMIYKQPGFPFFHSIGNTNFFQGFRSEDPPLDFGVLHVYWDKDAEDGIYLLDEEGEVKPKINGGWRHRWFDPDQTPEPWNNFGEDLISEKGRELIIKAHLELINKWKLRKPEGDPEEAKQPVLN